MKKLLSVLLVSISLMGWSQERVLFDELSDENYDLFGIMMYENEVFNGVSFKNYDDGTLSSEQTYKDGKKDGLFKYYNKNGTLSSEQTYKDGKLDGLSKEWYTNGQLSREGILKDGKKEGDFKWYYENGQISQEKKYKNGKQVGKETGYHENGQKSSYQYFNKKDGKLIDGVVYQWYENGQKSLVLEFRNDREDNWIIKFDENGQIIEKTKFEGY